MRGRRLGRSVLPTRVAVPILVSITVLAALPSPAWALDLALEGLADGTLFHQGPRPVVHGTTDAPPGSAVEGRLVPDGDPEPDTGSEGPIPATAATVVDPDGSFVLVWPGELPGGAYLLEVTVISPRGQVARAGARLLLQAEGDLPRRPLVGGPEPGPFAPPVGPATDDFQVFTDRWRLVPPPYELNTEPSPWNPYRQNRLKGDYPVWGQDVFFVLTAVSDTLVDGAQLPTPAGISTDRPGSISFFGDDEQLLANQLLLLSGDLFKGDTAFEPPEWRVKGTLAVNLNHFQLEENAAVSPDVRDGTSRTRGFLAVEELFYERRLKVLSAKFDFLSVRVGVQPFNSDFRGFVFTDVNLGVRLFGSLRSNRYQYNLAYFERLEKDTNSGLNTFELRDQRVVVANLYKQDFLTRGLTVQASLHYLQDDATFVFDKNDFLVRPDPVGSFTPHEIEATYLGVAAFGHVGRLNVDGALYGVFGRDSLNPIAGRDLFAGRDGVDVEAGMAALELSVDKDWLRPRVSLLWASGDGDPTDRTARGFDAIFDNPNFAGGGFSFWNRLGVRLPATGVALVHRGSLLASLKSSKEEGQPNFVNPGLRLVGVGVEAEVTPELVAAAQINHLAFDTTETLELLLFQSDIGREIGWDLSVGGRWRPFLNENVALLGGISALLPGDGFADVYEDDEALVAGFANLRLTF